MILEIGVSIIGIVLTISALFDDLSDTFDYTKWKSWVKFIPQVLLISACGFRFVKKLRIEALATSIVSLIGFYYLILFNTRESSILVCDEYSDICAEKVDVLYTGEVLKAATALPYLIGLAVSIIGSTLLARETYFMIENNKIGVKK
ncbi:unnamed protein product [Blepharisma stoltei]|uniref:Uncharacterized protein n=1 Tax=Blepharisma stoltei TaxID=1481888 RepID=A0AAU9JYE3_9CILI|nr:unnamed protein product [Blepharisma stoltei]